MKTRLAFAALAGTLAALAGTLAATPAPPATPAALAALAPAASPPIGPLERYDPKMYDVRFEVEVNTQIPWGQDDPRYRSPRDSRPFVWGGTIRVTDAPIVMPVVFEGAYHQVARDTVGGHLWLQLHPDPSVADRFRIDSGAPFDTHLAVLPIVNFVGKQFRWDLLYRMQSFSCRIDEEAAARVAWPREWTEAVKDGLRPQFFIESDDPIFAATVERVAGSELRMVPPYYAAKDLVRYCIKEMTVSGSGVRRGRAGVLHGMELVGAKQAALQRRGTEHDLVCVCVAVLRAAGIPARPVIGVEEDKRGRNTFVSWAEFYLPEAGWVPFDPEVMRGKGLHRHVREPWPEFGTLDDLNERVPLAYHFIPPRAVQSPMNAALWGWDPRPNGAPDAEQFIRVTVSGRGAGVEDPR